MREWIGVGHRLRGCGRGRQAGGGQDAEQAISGAVVGRLRRHFRPGSSTRCSAVGSLLVSAAFATTALDVSGTSARAGGMALVTGGAGWAEPAEASFIGPALTWTVLTLTGFIGSDEPGIAAIGWVWITPLVSGAGSGLACGGRHGRGCLREHRSCRRCGRTAGGRSGRAQADAT